MSIKIKPLLSIWERAEKQFLTGMKFLCGVDPLTWSAWLPEEDIDLVTVAAEKVTFCLVNHMGSEVLANNAVPWLTYKDNMETVETLFHELVTYRAVCRIPV